jgi:hypothetical protein
MTGIKERTMRRGRRHRRDPNGPKQLQLFAPTLTRDPAATVRWAMLPEGDAADGDGVDDPLLVDHSGSAASTDRPEMCDAD